MLDGSKVVATVELTAADRGRIDVKLPKLPRGLHLIRTTFDGGDGFADSTSMPVPLLLW